MPDNLKLTYRVSAYYEYKKWPWWLFFLPDKKIKLYRLECIETGVALIDLDASNLIESFGYGQKIIEWNDPYFELINPYEI
jgi:hypothetical protein